ncbi:MAG: co-chaperone GroES [Acidobacteria bacterium]|nr:co-chaperone GroES [Acidobacteriota bacterium]MDW7984179.1 co-chaperone GroES [Acidobacteriota bacterium]
MAWQLRPLYDRVIAKRIEPREEVRGGIIIPDVARERPMLAEVVAVGAGRVLENGKVLPLDVRPGQKVLIGKYAGSEVKIEGVEYVILREDEILGIVVEE